MNGLHCRYLRDQRSVHGYDDGSACRGSMVGFYPKSARLTVLLFTPQRLRIYCENHARIVMPNRKRWLTGNQLQVELARLALLRAAQ